MTNDEARNNAKARMTREFVFHHFSYRLSNRTAQEFGVRGHVRALKAATCRRTPKGASSDFVIPSSFAIRASSFLGAAALHRNRLPEFINSDQRKDAVCDPAPLARHVSRYPYLHRNRH